MCNARYRASGVENQVQRDELASLFDNGAVGISGFISFTFDESMILVIYFVKPR